MAMKSPGVMFLKIKCWLDLFIVGHTKWIDIVGSGAHHL